MEDPRHAVLAASRQKSGGDLHHSLHIRGEDPDRREHPRGAGDGADQDDFKEEDVERKLSRELAADAGGSASKTAAGSYHQGVVRLRSREVEEEQEEQVMVGGGGSLVEKRKSQLEGSTRNQWNYADSFHNFKKDRVKVCFEQVLCCFANWVVPYIVKVS